MNTHTPGPWWHSNGEVGTAPMMHVKIARVSGANFDEARANGRLIAAAPELLEAARAAMQCIGELAPTQARVEVAQMLQLALMKATGEQS